MTISLCLCLGLGLALSLTMAPASWAAGSGGGGGFSAPASSDNAKPRSAKQRAKAGYKDARKKLARAQKYETKAAKAKTEAKRKKQLDRAQKQYGDAVRTLLAVVQLTPEQAEPYNELGFALRKTGYFKQAVAMYNNAIKLRPDFPEAIEYRAEAFLALGEYELVKSAYMQLVQMGADEAGLLMAAMQSWTEQPAAAAPEAQDFLRWVSERSDLAKALGTGTSTTAANW